MLRQSTKIDIPEIYIENEEKGVCRVCGNSIKKPFRKYCSTKCSIKYQECFKTWTGLRNKVLSKQDKCEKCGSEDKLEVDHKIAIVNGGEMWKEDNLQVLCHKHHVKKTKSDLYNKKYVKEGQKLMSNF